MKKILMLFLMGALFVATGSAARTFTGVITDSMCGVDHKSMKMGSDDKCTKECVRTSSDKKTKYALNDGKNVYVLSDQQTPESFAGQHVRVTGKLFEKTKILQVDKIEAVH